MCRSRAGPTSDSAEITRSLAGTEPPGRTALLDAVALALQELKISAKLRKAIVILSDGGDNRSRRTEGLGVDLSLEDLAGPGLMQEITEATGRRLFPVSYVNRLPEIASRIGVELHNQYLLAYSQRAMQHDRCPHRVGSCSRQEPLQST